MAILIKPILTEKQTAVSEKFSAQKEARAKKKGEATDKLPTRYGFIVSPCANKVEIKNAVEELYKVEVETVNTMNYDGRKSSRNTASGVIVGRASSYKKAIITLKEGSSIDLFSNI